MKHEINNDVGGKGETKLRINQRPNSIQLVYSTGTMHFTMSKDMTLKLIEELLDAVDKIDS